MTTRRAPGEGSVFQRADGLWVARLDVTRPGHPRRRKTLYAKTRPAAQRKLAELKRERDAHGLGEGQVPTVEAWMTVWLDEIAADTVRPTTLAGYRSKVKHQIVPRIGRHRLDKLSAEHVRGMLAAMKADGLSDNTRLQTYAILAKALGDAHREDKVRRNVARLVKPPRPDVPELVALDDDEVLAIMKAARSQRLESRWLVALALGLRQGEALGLGWEHVDLDAGTLTVARALARVDGRLVMQEPKTKKSRRTVPLPDFLVALLTARRDAWQREPRDSEWASFGLVWGQPNGRPIDQRSDYGAWQQLLDDAGVRRVRLHDARHSAASVLAMMGVPEFVMMAILGHSQIAVTQRYVHPDLTAMRAAMALVDARYRELTG